MADRRIGFVGLGSLGMAIAERLTNQGIRVLGYDIADVDVPRENSNLEMATSLQLLTQEAETFFLCLPNETALLDVCLGSEGIAKTSKAKVCINLSTIGRNASIDAANGLREFNVEFVDAPVSGGAPAAREGRLTLMLSGNRERIREIQPLFDVIGTKQFFVSPHAGGAQVMKLVNNLLAASNLVFAVEALVCGAKAGLDPEMILDVVNVSSGRNSATEDKMRDYVLTRTFDWGASIETLHKDLKLLMAQAEDLGVPLLGASQVIAIYNLAVARGRANDDITSLILELEEWSGTKVCRSSATTTDRAGENIQ